MLGDFFPLRLDWIKETANDLELPGAPISKTGSLAIMEITRKKTF